MKPLHAGHIEECFIEAQRFDERRDVSEGGHDSARYVAVKIMVARQKDRMGAESLRLRRWHCAKDAIGASLIRRCCHDSSTSSSTDDDGLAPQFWRTDELNGHIERVHIDMEDHAFGHELILSS